MTLSDYDKEIIKVREYRIKELKVKEKELQELLKVIKGDIEEQRKLNRKIKGRI